MPHDTMKSWPSLAPFGKTLSMSGGELFYYDSDSNSTNNKPTIILIHGLGDEADSWRHLFPLLIGAGYRVIAPDLPGFGRSRWKGRISMSGHCRAVTQLMSMTGAASAERPAVLAGSSLGAGIAEIVAYRNPHLAKALILLDGCLPFEFKTDKAMFLMSLPFVGKGWYRSFRRNHEAAWKSLYPYYRDLEAMSEADKTFLRERVIARVESVNQERGYFATLRSMNAFFLLRRRTATRIGLNVPCKIALLWGEQDRIFPPNRAALLRRLRPDAYFTLIADASHLPHQEKPDVCAAEILRFLQSQE
jgi:pimeloyl-ACP methyl ester carboxylesterase